MSIVKINDNLRVEVESKNLILQKINIIQEGKNKGEINWVTEGYYTDWDDIFKRLIRDFTALKLKKKEVTELKELRGIYLEVKKEVKALLGDFV